MAALPNNLAHAKAHLSELVDRALDGEDIIIARRNKPLVRMVPLDPPGRNVLLGRFIDRLRMSDDFDAPLDDFEASMEAALEPPRQSHS